MQFDNDERNGAVVQAFISLNRRVEPALAVDGRNCSFRDWEGLPPHGVLIQAFSGYAFSEEVIVSHSGARWDLYGIRDTIGVYSTFAGPSFTPAEPALYADYAVARRLVEYAIERLAEVPQHDAPVLGRATPVPIETQREKFDTALAVFDELEAEDRRRAVAEFGSNSHA